MGDLPPEAAALRPCCVCYAPGGKHCTTCKSTHYCSKACQRVDWYDRGHKARCGRLAAEFQDRLLDALMPEKVKISEPAVSAVAPAAPEDAGADAAGPGTDAEGAFADVAPSSVDTAPAGPAAARAPTARPAPPTRPAASDARPAAASPTDGSRPPPADSDEHWRGTCAVCLDLLPLLDGAASFYVCCCRRMCTICCKQCLRYDDRCPLCRAPVEATASEQLRQLRKHVAAGRAEAQVHLGDAYRHGRLGLKRSAKRAAVLHDLAARQGHARAQERMGSNYLTGDGVKIDLKAAALWHRRAAEQGHPVAQFNLAVACSEGKGVPQSDADAVRWYRAAAAQGDAGALYNLGYCYSSGRGVPQDLEEALKLCGRAAAKGHDGAAAAVNELEARLAVMRRRRPS